MSTDTFKSQIEEGYKFEGETIVLGAGMLEGAPVSGAHIKVPLKTLNRHGLIAGATGTGKTKSLQVITEQLANNGVPSIIMDIKGDLSGIAAPSAAPDKMQERHNKIGNLDFVADKSSVEFLTLSGEPGARLRATVSEFGPILLSKILELNATQSGLMSVIFQYCDNKNLALLDLKDLKKTLQYISNEGKEEIEADYGSVSSASTGTLLRKIVELEQQGADVFFGEKSFEVSDLTRIDENGKGMVNILRLTDIQSKPKLFSTFMLQMLAEVYAEFPEQGDADRPKLCIFIDEAHLLFSEASDALLDQVESVVKLIRSKGVGIFFITQNPNDIPDAILGQLGLKVQHALRAFTAKDRKAIKTAAQNFPDSDFYDVADLLTQMGIGESLVTVLGENGIPTPLAHTYMRAPQSRMDVLTKAEIDSIINSSSLVAKYNEEIDRESAFEILSNKIQGFKAAAEEAKDNEEAKKEAEAVEKARIKAEKAAEKEADKAAKARGKIAGTVGKELGNLAVRGLLGAFGVKTRKRKFF